MKNTLAVTSGCNLACDYCYIGKSHSVMSLSTAGRIIDFIFRNAPENEKIEINFFGGEPLLEFDLLKRITDIIQLHPSYDAQRVIISVTTNGTIFSEEIADFLLEKNMILCISCDGPPHLQDASRHFTDGSESSGIVEKNIKHALKIFPLTPVNAVFSPWNLQYLPDVVEYLSSIGVMNIYLNHNISAKWTKKEADMLPQIYSNLGRKYLDYYIQGNPRYISLIDSKIAVILRGGYQPLEKCRMGFGEFAFGPSGNIYPCERFIGADDKSLHCLGNINDGFTSKRTCSGIPNTAINTECMTCGLRDYCMNWCGCTNYFSTGQYQMVAPFICASEKSAIKAAFQIIKDMGDNISYFSHHLAGTPLMSVVREALTCESTGRKT